MIGPHNATHKRKTMWPQVTLDLMMARQPGYGGRISGQKAQLHSSSQQPTCRAIGLLVQESGAGDIHSAAARDCDGAHHRR